MILNLDNGNYYNLSGAGTEIWSLLESGASAARIVGELSSKYKSEPGSVERSIGELLTDLEREGLIRSDPVQGREEVSSFSTRGNESAPFFAKPVFNKYTDMQELLLMDPIHEVDPSGWPRGKKD